jgi:hypothetical protein
MSRDLGADADFTDFVGDCLGWSITQLQGLSTESTPIPIDAQRRRSRGGKHSQCKVTRKNANTMPVQKSIKIQSRAPASDDPARI